MTKPIPHIKHYMTTCPQTIGPEQALASALHTMSELSIRHLPVLRANKLVGMISQRDIALVGSIDGTDPLLLRVEDAMSTDVYSVSPEAPLDEVLGELASHRYGSAVIEQNGKVVGIFTLVDACRATVELLHGRLTH